MPLATSGIPTSAMEKPCAFMKKGASIPAPEEPAVWKTAARV